MLELADVGCVRLLDTLLLDACLCHWKANRSHLPAAALSQNSSEEALSSR